MKKSSKQHGFSIIEIAVTLVVLGLIITSAIPNISSWLRNTKLRNQAESVLAGLQQARNEAVRLNRPVTFWMVNLPTAGSMDGQCTLSNTGTSWVVSLDDPTGKCNVTDSTQSPHMVASRVGMDGSTGVSLQGLKSDGTSAASSVSFDGFGRASGDISRVNISFAQAATDDRPLRIELSTAGLARMCDTKVTTAGDPRLCSTGTFQ